MKKFVWLFLFVFVLSVTVSASSDDENWKIVFEDNFDGPQGTFPDAKKWVNDVGGGGWGNREHQYYTRRGRNGFVDGKGNLVIRAQKFNNSNRFSCWYGKCKYTSARLLTKGKFATKYGKVESRIKLPKGQGIWPAFWMLGTDIDKVSWPRCGEIDIMENLGHQSRKIHGTVHGPGYAGAKGIGKSYKVKKSEVVSENFNTYSIIWTEKKIEWFFNGRRFNRLRKEDLPKGAPWVFNKEYFLLLNLAVGGRWPGYPDKKTMFPQEMLVDYVRVYQEKKK